MNKLHLYHISFFDSLLKGLKANGVSIEKLTQGSILKRFDLSSPDTYLPLEVAYELFTKTKRKQGIDCISGEFYGGFQLEDLSDYGEYLSKCPDLKSILSNAIKYESLIQTNTRAELKTEGELSWMSVFHNDPPSEGKHVSERINLAIMLKGMQLVLGQEWSPLEIHITSPEAYWLENLMPSGNFRLKTNCPEIAFGFKTEELATRNKHYSNKKHLDNKNICSMEEITFRVLNSMHGNYVPTLEEFSEYFGYSKRTLIREFSKAKKTYGEIIDERRFDHAIQLLQNSSMNIRKISTELGYSTTSNFARAFRRWSDSTPQQYRSINTFC